MATMHNRQRWHSAIGATNLNDTPSRGPLTADDLRPHWPSGDAANDDEGDDLDAARGVLLGLCVVALALAGVLALL